MKRCIHSLFALLLSFAATAGLQAQNTASEAIYIYRNDGDFNAFFHKDIDSIVCSSIGLDSTVYAYDVVQEFHTPDSVYRIPLSAIDSVAFSAPQPVLQPNVVRMEENLLDYLTAVDGMRLTFTSLPKPLYPSKGEILVCTDFENPLFEEGFVGKVYDSYARDNNYIVECDTVSDITEIFERLISIEEMVLPEESYNVPGARDTRASGEWSSATIPITMDLNYDSGTDVSGTGVKMSGSLNAAVRATVAYNITKDSQHIGLTLHHDWNLGAGIQAEVTKKFFKTTPARELTPALRFPAALPVLKFQLYGALFVRGEGSAELSVDLTGPVNRYVTSVNYTNGRFAASHSNVGNGGDFTPEFSGSLHLKGEVQGGGLLDMYLGTIKCLGYVKSAVDFYIGPQLSGDFAWDAESAGRLDYYNTIKNSKIGLSLLTVGVEAYGEAAYLGETIARHTFFDMEMPGLFYNEWYLFPEFSETTVEKDASQRTAKLNCRPSRNVLLPLTLGYGLYDKEGKLLECQMADESYKQDNSGYLLEETFVDLKRNKTYEARPMIQFMGNGIPATPAKEFSLECSVTTGGVTNIEETSATCSGMAELPNEYTLCSYGICYSDYNSNPTIDNSMVLEAGGGENFSVTLSGLDDDTRYYYCAYLVIDDNRYYGEVRSFTTKEEDKEQPTPGDAIDLGLSVMWASCNVGAASPSDYGDYFAWGETSPKSDYDWDTYKWGNDWNNLYKYNTDSYYGTVDNKTVLDSSDDAATANWGSEWRMPTKEEIEELFEKCDWTWTTVNGVNGRLVVGPNGNSIFLPAAGCRFGASLYRAGSYGYFWSSSLNSDYPDGAYYLYFYSGDLYWFLSSRNDGRSVRPVRASARN